MRTRRILEILEAVAEADVAVTANQLANKLQVPKATVYRICEELRDEGYIRPSLRRRGFVLGPTAWRLMRVVMAGRAQYAHRHAILERVSRLTGETCNLSVPDPAGMRYWDRVETQWPLRLSLPIGTLVPLHCTSAGKMFLSSLARPRRNALIHELELKQLAPNTIVDRAELERACDRIRRENVSTDNEEYIEGMIAVAVPVRDDGGRFLASLAIHAPRVRLSLEDALEFVPALREAADRIADFPIDERT